jgi:hypothetical protein
MVVGNLEVAIKFYFEAGRVLEVMAKVLAGQTKASEAREVGEAAGEVGVGAHCSRVVEEEDAGFEEAHADPRHELDSQVPKVL